METGGYSPGRIARLILGLLGPWRGLKYLAKHPSLLPLAALPALANFLVFLAVIWALAPRATGLVHKLLPGWDAGWYWIVIAPLLVLAWALVFLLGILLINLLGNVIACPFNDILSAHVEKCERRLPVETVSWGQTVSRMGISALHELKKWIFYFLCLAILLPLHLVPVIGSILWTVVCGILSFWFLGFEYIDYSFSRRNLSFAERKAFCLDHFCETVGLGMSVSGTLFIPLCGLLVMPLSVVGSTLLYLELTPIGIPKNENEAGGIHGD